MATASYTTKGEVIITAAPATYRKLDTDLVTLRKTARQGNEPARVAIDLHILAEPSRIRHTGVVEVIECRREHRPVQSQAASCQGDVELVDVSTGARKVQ